MPGLSAMAVDTSYTPKSSIDLPVPAPAVALPNLVQLLLREALTMKMSAPILNRLLNRPGSQPFSEACVVGLRSKLGAEQVSDLCAFDASQVDTLHDLAPDEKSSLVDLCNSLKQELSTLSLLLLAPANIPSSYICHLSSRSQQTGICLPNSEDTSPLSASNGGHQNSQGSSPLSTSNAERHCTLEHQSSEESSKLSEDILKPAVQEKLASPARGKTPYPEHEEKHFSGKCQPCVYFFKPDSCRWGVECDFCHLCPEGEIRKRKKEKMRAMREQALQEKKAKQNLQVKGVKQTPQFESVSANSKLNSPYGLTRHTVITRECILRFCHLSFARVGSPVLSVVSK